MDNIQETEQVAASDGLKPAAELQRSLKESYEYQISETCVPHEKRTAHHDPVRPRLLATGDCRALWEFQEDHCDLQGAHHCKTAH